MKYITSIQAAEKWNISQRRVAVLCSQNRITGAVKAGKTWLIPDSCTKPADLRTDKNIEYKISNDELIVSERGASYLAKTELMLNPVLVQQATVFYSKMGKTLSEGINDYMTELFSCKTEDYSSTYPTGFFKLFGCAPGLDIPDNINDLLPEDITL